MDLQSYQLDMYISDYDFLQDNEHEDHMYLDKDRRIFDWYKLWMYRIHYLQHIEAGMTVANLYNSVNKNTLLAYWPVYIGY